MSVMITLGKLFLRFLYALMKLAPVKNRICMLSRESDSPPLDFLMLEQELKALDGGLKIKYVCELLNSESRDYVKILKNTLRCMYALSTSEACVVDTYCLPLSVLPQRKGLVAAQIWHAAGAVKRFGCQCVGSAQGREESLASTLSMHKNYSFITCASEETRRIYSEAFSTPADRVLVLGMPRLDYLTQNGSDKEARRAGLLKKHPELSDKLNILYAPTFRENGKIQLEEMLSLIDFNKYNLIVKAHILDNVFADDERIINEDSPVFDLFSVADYVITDYSATSFEAAAAGKKLLFYVYDIADYARARGLNINPLTEYPELSSESFFELYKTIENDEYPQSALDSFTEKYLETLDGDCAHRIAEEILNRCKTRV